MRAQAAGGRRTQAAGGAGAAAHVVGGNQGGVGLLSVLVGSASRLGGEGVADQRAAARLVAALVLDLWGRVLQGAADVSWF